MKSPDSYFMNDTREARRLVDKVDISAWIARYLTPHLNGARRVLDVGCGPRVLALNAARLHSSMQFTGIDLCGNRFSPARKNMPTNLELRACDACSLPFEADSFDFVYCRFLLEYLPDREQAVREMVRVCRPGGRVLLQDLDGQLIWHYPEDDELQDQLHRVLAGLSKTGFDPFVGRKLFAISKYAGLGAIKVTAESYHLYAGAIDEQNEHLWETKLDIAMPMAVKILGSEVAAMNLRSRFLDYLRRDDTLTYSVVFTVIGQKTDVQADTTGAGQLER